ncbi:MAG: MFS transporter [Acidimicrobiaceae bacterium]|nr:MFS transporter [Acidimicrobiaceae bacterium]MCY4176075.1 MFS transporter [Acidimicrobiaceae bacterium]MCY4279734.1 MFS transporter [Acidimicrobiaceae bacterium]MCY4293948.1 MFS transporter [Acidimicrobiaceae bacterium]
MTGGGVRVLLGPRYRAVSVSLIGTVAMASYNNLSVTAALPDIGDDLGRVALLPWVVTVELLAAAVAVLAVGPFIDGAGAQRAFRVTVAAFLAASALCALAPTMELLIAARILQGMGSGALIGTAFTCIGLVYDDTARPWAYALFSSVWGVMGIGGPALAAVLVSTLGWRAVFAFNLPVAAAAAAVGWRRLPQQAPEAAADPLDRRGLVTLSALTVALLLATSGLNWYSVALLAAAVLLGFGYARHARAAAAPVVRLEHISGVQWRSIHLLGSLTMAGGTGASVFLPLYLKAGRGSSAAFAAFAVLWMTLGWSTASWVSGAMQQRFHAATVALIGACIISVSAISVTAAVALEAPVAVLLAMFACVGWGIGTISTSSMALLQGRAEPREMGRISSAHHFLRSLGFAYGAAFAGLVIFWAVERSIGDTELVRDLLGDSDLAVDAAVADALRSAYAWSLAAMAALCTLTLPAAAALARRYDPERATRD